MLSQSNLPIVSSQLQNITLRSDIPFGDIKVLLVLDMGQLPPVGGVTMWSRTGYSREPVGRLLFMNPVSVVVLKVNVRQAGDSHLQQQFRDFLGRLRNGLATHDDWVLVAQQSKTHLGEAVWQSQFEASDTTWFYNTNKAVAICNIKILKESGKPIIIVKAKHSGPGAASASAETADNLDPILAVSSGIELMLLANIWTAVGLSNSVCGTFIEMIYEDGMNHLGGHLPLAAVCSFQSYCGPPFFINNVEHLDENGRVNIVNTMAPYVPIPTKTAMWENASVRQCSRTRLPLRLSSAFTTHKGQGLSCRGNCGYEFGPREFTNSQTYVACSRPTQFLNFGHTGVTRDRLTINISSSKGLLVRLKAEIELLEKEMQTIESHREQFGDQVTSTLVQCHNEAIAKMRQDALTLQALQSTNRQGMNEGRDGDTNDQNSGRDRESRNTGGGGPRNGSNTGGRQRAGAPSLIPSHGVGDQQQTSCEGHQNHGRGRMGGRQAQGRAQVDQREVRTNAGRAQLPAAGIHMIITIEEARLQLFANRDRISHLLGFPT